MFGMSGAGKSVNMIDLLTQTEPYYDYTVIVEEGLSYGIYTQTVAEGAQPIIIQPNGTLTFNYLDTTGLPLTSLQIANATALVPPHDRHLPRRGQGPTARRPLVQRHPPALPRLSRRLETPTSRITPRTPAAGNRPASGGWPKNCHPVPLCSMPTSTFAITGPGRMRGMARCHRRAITSPRPNTTPRPAKRPCGFAFANMKSPVRCRPIATCTRCWNMDGHGTSGEESRHLAQLLEPWCSHGNYGAILDGESNVESGRTHRPLRTRLHPRVRARPANRRRLPDHQPRAQRSHDAAARCPQARHPRRAERVFDHPRRRPHHPRVLRTHAQVQLLGVLV